MTAAGRGHDIAAELVKAGNLVLCVDLTNQLGVWPPEDLVGPFGEFLIDRYTPVYREMLNNGDSFVSVNEGFSVWHDRGPMEYRGALAQNMLTKLGVDPLVIGAILNGQPVPNLHLIDFKNRWPLTLLRAISSSYDDHFDFDRNHKNYRDGSLPVSSDFQVLYPTRRGFEKNLDWLRSLGVLVSDKSKIVDFSKGTAGSLSGAELQGELQGLYGFKQLVWCLSSEETYYISEKLGRLLFPEGVNEPVWSWVRYRVNIVESMERDRLPVHFVHLLDPFSPWTHENLMIIQRTAVVELFDVWLKIPAIQRFNKDYLREHGVRVVNSLQNRFPVGNVSIQTLPQEYSYTLKDIGPPRFPVYDQRKISFKGSPFSNARIDSAELRGSYSRESQFDDHQKIVAEINHWKAQQLAQNSKAVSASGKK